MNTAGHQTGELDQRVILVYSTEATYSKRPGVILSVNVGSFLTFLCIYFVYLITFLG